MILPLPPFHVDFTIYIYVFNDTQKVRWQNWSRPDGTNTTWMRDVEGDPAFVVSWNEAMKNQRLEKALESQSIDLVSLAATPMHDRLTFERAQAIEEKMAERLRKGAPGKVYQGWMAEIDRQVAHHQRRGEMNPSSSSTVPKKRKKHREPSLCRYVCALKSLPHLPCTHFKRNPYFALLSSGARGASYAESSRAATSRNRRFSVTWGIAGETSTASDGDFSSDGEA